ncbi:MAG: hypothetical protein ACK5Q5_03905 [Planctomycetaceae bacterium]
MFRRAQPLLDVRPVRHRVQAFQALSDQELRHQFDGVREEAGSGRTGRSIRTEVFALATEAVRRTSGKSFYDVQLQAGDVLARGDLAEMATGEGKTLVTLLPVIDRVAHGHGVHVATTNSYLAERDCREAAPALDLLGISVGLLPEQNDNAAKRRAYDCNVTYGTGYEFGFDYLRDQLTLRSESTGRLGDRWLQDLSADATKSAELVQRTRQVAIVDEIDSVLIDEANTPLVIALFVNQPADRAPFRRAAELVETLSDGEHFQIDVATQRVTITPAGCERVNASQQANLQERLQRPWRIYIEQALRAKYLLQRDVDFIIRDGAVALVDQQTGRIFPERKWRDGLHQAVEYRAGVTLTQETNSLARISRQRYFKQYPQATGMTGTAADAADEFREFFGLSVQSIPLHRPSQRVRLPNRYFLDALAKYRAMTCEVAGRHRNGQPCLIGTRTVEQSRVVSDLLAAAGIPHQTLNGLQTRDEAEIIAMAGESGAVTVATNMAGRGTDIKLSAESREAGGLHVLAAEPNRSHRVDRQLIGRAARQGDPGSCQLFVSADDELLEVAGATLSQQIRRRANTSGEAEISLDDALLAVQRRTEQLDFDYRKQLLQQESWVESVLDTLVGTG